MNFNNTGKVNEIQTEEDDDMDEYSYDDYDDEDLDFESNATVEQEEEPYQPEEPPQETEEDDEKYRRETERIELKRKLIKIMVIIGMGMLLLLLILSIASKLGKKSYTYEDVEAIMKSAAESYFNENSSNLPKSDGQSVELDVNNLINSGRMKSLDEYLGEEGNSCTGKVQVKKVADKYVYTSYLNCGSNYSTKVLSDTITKETNLVGSGYGLYYQNNAYVFRGEDVNNYVQMDAQLWRIVRVNSDKTVLLTLAKPLNYTVVYDDRYNSQSDDDNGINTYATSRIKEQLELVFNTEEKTSEERYILSEEDKAHLVKYDVCVGKMNYTDKIHDNSLECSMTTQEYMGLLTVSDYMNASIDTGCTEVSSQGCQNYNWLGANGSYWLVTPSTKNTSSAYKVSNGVIKINVTNEFNRLRPAITLSAGTLISDGDGTKDNPYIVK